MSRATDSLEHPSVKHPLRAHTPRPTGFVAWNDRVLEWLGDQVLASMIMFDIALIVPLLVIPMSSNIKITLGVISGSWIQWWALPALQRSQVKADKKREAKADADHRALTNIALRVDAIYERLNERQN